MPCETLTSFLGHMTENSKVRGVAILQTNVSYNRVNFQNSRPSNNVGKSEMTTKGRTDGRTDISNNFKLKC